MDELIEEMEEDTQKYKYLTFHSGDECYGIELKYVEEIIGFMKITTVPETEDYIMGLINLRGKIIPVIDVRIRFKQEPFEYTDRTCIIIINVKSTIVGLIVEKIAEVVTIPEDNIVPPPVLNTNYTKNSYVYGLGKIDGAVKMLLDPEKLIKDDELGVLEQLAAENNTVNEEEEEL